MTIISHQLLPSPFLLPPLTVSQSRVQLSASLPSTTPTTSKLGARASFQSASAFGYSPYSTYPFPYPVPQPRNPVPHPYLLYSSGKGKTHSHRWFSQAFLSNHLVLHAAAVSPPSAPQTHLDLDPFPILNPLSPAKRVSSTHRQQSPAPPNFCLLCRVLTPSSCLCVPGFDQPEARSVAYTTRPNHHHQRREEENTTKPSTLT